MLKYPIFLSNDGTLTVKRVSWKLGGSAKNPQMIRSNGFFGLHQKLREKAPFQKLQPRIWKETFFS